MRILDLDQPFCDVMEVWVICLPVGTRGMWSSPPPDLFPDTRWQAETSNESDNIESDNIESDNIESDNIESDNIELINVFS